MRISCFLTVLACLSFTFSATAQREETLLNGRGLRLTGAWGGSTLAGTQINGEMAALTGGWGGIELNKNFFVGYGDYFTDANVRFDELDNENFKLRYSGIMLGFAPGAHNTVHPQISVLAARGKLGVTDGALDRIYVVQPQLGLEVNVTRWFRAGLNGGYRFLLDSDIPNLDDKKFSGAYGELNFKFGWSWGSRHKNYGDTERL